MHGTYLVDTVGEGDFDIQFPRNVKTMISNGDVIRFGVQLSKSAQSIFFSCFMTAANGILDVGLRPPAFRCEMRHIESIDMTSPGGKSFSVPGDSVAESDAEALDSDPYDVEQSPSPVSHSEGT